jgi:hypothetical protein
MQPCCICGDVFTVVAHHLTHGELNATGRKAGDDRAVPLCHQHHNQLHLFPFGERAFWQEVVVDPDEVIKEMLRLSPLKNGE